MVNQIGCFSMFVSFIISLKAPQMQCKTISIYRNEIISLNLIKTRKKHFCIHYYLKQIVTANMNNFFLLFLLVCKVCCTERTLDKS